MEYNRAEKDVSQWIEGKLVRYVIVPGRIVDEMDLVYSSARLSARTDDGEWRRLTVELPEEGGDIDDLAGEYREVQSATVVAETMWEFREAALEEANSLRATSLRRAIYLDAACQYVASEEACDVWWDYREEVEESSLTGFIGWLEVETLRQLWGEVGKSMFFGEVDGVMDVGDRALADTLSVLRYFYS